MKGIHLEMYNEPASYLVGKRLKNIRMDLHYTQQEFVKELGITQQNLSLYERGLGYISVPIVIALHRMGYDTKWLLYGKGSMKIKDNEDVEGNISKLKNENKKLKTRIQEIESERAELSKELIQRLSEFVDLQKKLNNIIEER